MFITRCTSKDTTQPTKASQESLSASGASCVFNIYKYPIFPSRNRTDAP